MSSVAPLEAGGNGQLTAARHRPQRIEACLTHHVYHVQQDISLRYPSFPDDRIEPEPQERQAVRCRDPEPRTVERAHHIAQGTDLRASFVLSGNYETQALLIIRESSLERYPEELGGQC